MRTIVDLPAEQIRALADYCAREKVSRAKAVRRTVEQLLCAQRLPESDRLAATDAAFGLSEDHGIDREAGIGTALGAHRSHSARTDTYLRELMTWYDNAVRTIIDLREDQLAALDRIVADEKVSRAEAIRDAVDVYLRERKRVASRAAFGSWSHKKLDGLSYTEAARKEWDERERSLRQRLPD